MIEGKEGCDEEEEKEKEEKERAGERRKVDVKKDKRRKMKKMSRGEFLELCHLVCLNLAETRRGKRN